MKKPFKIVIIVLCVAVCAVGVYLLLKRGKSNNQEAEPAESGEKQLLGGGGGYAATAGTTEPVGTAGSAAEPISAPRTRTLGDGGEPKSKPVRPAADPHMLTPESMHLSMTKPEPRKKEKGLKL